MTVGQKTVLVMAVAAVCVVVERPDAAAQGARGLTAAPQIARVYEAIFDARFEQIPALLAQTCGPAPREACLLLETVALWWQIQIDPADPSRDALFRAKADASIAAAEAWARREPQRAETWFYLGGAYGARVQWRVLRGQPIAAARDGKRIKEALERALAIDPELQDAYFGIGLYHYYADVAPAAAKMLRFLLLLPAGDRVKGLEEMRRARDRGQLLKSESEYQLHILYLWYEHQPQRAIDLLAGLRERHPGNPHFTQLIAEVQDVYQHDLTASLRSWQALLDAARAGRVAEAGMAEARARLGIAGVLDRLFETDRAIDHLRAVIRANPAAPFGAVAQAHLQLGRCLDRLGRHAEAVAAYNTAIAATPSGDPLKVGEQARTALRETPNTTTANAYRLSLEGLRALERGALTDAARLFDQSLQLRPEDPVTLYRQATLLQAQKNDRAALPILETILRARTTTPPTFYASACIDAARIYERLGSRDRAIELYTITRRVFGADERTRDAAQRAITRLTTPSPASPR